MKRLTTDNPKDNVENALNLFYIKDRETWVRGGGPGPEYPDVSLFDFTRQIVRDHIPDVDLPADDGNLAMMMPEWLCDGSDTAEGIIALLYTAAWSYAELRHRLMAYEDTGLAPEEVAKFAKYERATRSLIKDLNDLMAYRMAEQEGRLLILPLKVGQAVYFVLEDLPVFYPETNGWYIGEAEVTEICTRGFSVDPIDGDEKSYFYPYDDIGKTVFLTREEAEAALASLSGA